MHGTIAPCHGLESDRGRLLPRLLRASFFGTVLFGLVVSLLSGCAVLGGQTPTPTHVTTLHGQNGALVGIVLTDFHSFGAAGGAVQIRSMDYWQGVPFPVLLPVAIDADKLILMAKGAEKVELEWGKPWPAEWAARFPPGVAEANGITFEAVAAPADAADGTVP